MFVRSIVKVGWKDMGTVYLDWNEGASSLRIYTSALGITTQKFGVLPPIDMMNYYRFCIRLVVSLSFMC